MATPHAAGMVARYLAEQGLHPSSASAVAAVRDAVVAASIPQSDPCGFTGDPDRFHEPLVFLNAVALGGDGACGASGPADTAPRISWTDPGDGAVVGGEVPVGADVTDVEDDAAALTVEFRAGGAGDWSAMSLTTGHRFTATWDSAGSGDGPTTLEIRATDTASNTTTASRVVTVDNHENVAPTASFTATCNGLACAFDASGSDDPDGTIVTYAWTFGDGAIGSGVTASHSYAGSGSATVTLTVTDDEGASDTATQTVTVTAPTTMTIGAVSAELAGRRNNQLRATVEVRSNGAAVSGAAVTGHFVVNGASVSASGTTGSNGVATLNGGRVRWYDLVSVFCVDGVSKAGLTLTTAVPSCVLVQP
jgi:PKD repeat protein